MKSLDYPQFQELAATAQGDVSYISGGTRRTIYKHNHENPMADWLQSTASHYPFWPPLSDPKEFATIQAIAEQHGCNAITYNDKGTIYVRLAGWRSSAEAAANQIHNTLPMRLCFTCMGDHVEISQ